MIVSALLLSVVTTYLLVRYSHLHAFATADTASGPQHFHRHAVSRAGGVAVIAAFAGTLWAYRSGIPHPREALLLLACSLPAAAGGLAEDLTKRTGVRIRLGCTMVAAGLAYFALGGGIHRLDAAGVDWLLSVGIVSFAFTALAVGGVANAINIVDGYNGLAGTVAILALGALAYVSSEVGDAFLVSMCLAMIGAIGGMLVWNFPHGKIFLGDGGAYFVGFMVAEISVLLVNRHPEVSPWFPFMLVAYPVWETLFSIYRKKALRGHSPGQPDGLHFHMLVYKRVARWKVGSRDDADRITRNSFTSPYLWALSLTTIVPALLFWRHTAVLAFGGAAFLVLYVWLYRSMVFFRVPRWLILHKPRARMPSNTVFPAVLQEGPGRPG
jgi:UDP-N-acetylmuramyl pentapeptide phosphotransferase/UDP-N-acetylglucosamine-1-phosphate transferase